MQFLQQFFLWHLLGVTTRVIRVWSTEEREVRTGIRVSLSCHHPYQVTNRFGRKQCRSLFIWLEPYSCLIVRPLDMKWQGIMTRQRSWANREALTSFDDVHEPALETLQIKASTLAQVVLLRLPLPSSFRRWGCSIKISLRVLPREKWYHILC